MKRLPTVSHSVTKLGCIMQGHYFGSRDWIMTAYQGCFEVVEDSRDAGV